MVLKTWPSTNHGARSVQLIDSAKGWFEIGPVESMVGPVGSTFFFFFFYKQKEKNILIHFALKRQHFLRELDHSTRSPFNPFLIKLNKLLVVQVNGSCMHFIPHNPYIYIYIYICYPFFYVGLVSEKNFFL